MRSVWTTVTTRRTECVSTSNHPQSLPKKNKQKRTETSSSGDSPITVGSTFPPVRAPRHVTGGRRQLWAVVPGLTLGLGRSPPYSPRRKPLPGDNGSTNYTCSGTLGQTEGRSILLTPSLFVVSRAPHLTLLSGFRPGSKD